jgi:hypothetical protein
MAMRKSKYTPKQAQALTHSYREYQIIYRRRKKADKSTGANDLVAEMNYSCTSLAILY